MRLHFHTSSECAAAGVQETEQYRVRLSDSRPEQQSLARRPPEYQAQFPGLGLDILRWYRKFCVKASGGVDLPVFNVPVGSHRDQCGQPCGGAAGSRRCCATQRCACRAVACWRNVRVGVLHGRKMMCCGAPL